jgi:hypothetical protein
MKRKAPETSPKKEKAAPPKKRVGDADTWEPVDDK